MNYIHKTLSGKVLVISPLSYYADTFQTVEPNPDYYQTLQTFPDFSIIPDIIFLTDVATLWKQFQHFLKRHIT